jgi:D-alanine-D-alanine ligase
VTRIVVVTGGSTPERDVAFAGAAQVVGALRARGYSVAVVDTTSGLLAPDDEARLLTPAVGREPPSRAALAELAGRELGPALVTLPAVRGADLVFPVLHGLQGEGGGFQALLEMAGIPYVGSGPLGSALAMDKDVAKQLFRRAGVPTADWCMWPAEAPAVAALGLPVVVKPVKVGSTVGLTVVDDAGGIPAAVALAREFDDEVMLEAFIPGREFTVGVLEDRALAVGEIIPRHAIFDYECKYTPGLTDEVFPAQIPPELAATLQDLALRAHRALKLRDFSRVDFRLMQDGTPLCLEANTLPGLTRTSLLPQSAAADGLPFSDLCERICRLGLARAAGRNKLPSRPVASR